MPETPAATRLNSLDQFRGYTVAAMFSDKKDDSPTSTDFAKMVDHNTRLDPFAGYQQVVVTGARTALAETTNGKGQVKITAVDDPATSPAVLRYWLAQRRRSPRSSRRSPTPSARRRRGAGPACSAVAAGVSIRCR